MKLTKEILVDYTSNSQSNLNSSQSNITSQYRELVIQKRQNSKPQQQSWFDYGGKIGFFFIC